MADWDDAMSMLAGAVEDAFGSHTISITYQARSGFNASAMTPTGTTSALLNIPAARSEVGLFIDGEPMTGVEYTVKASRVSTIPKRGDVVLEGAVSRTVVETTLDASGAILRIRCRDAAKKS